MMALPRGPEQGVANGLSRGRSDGEGMLNVLCLRIPRCCMSERRFEGALCTEKYTQYIWHSEAECQCLFCSINVP